MTECFTLSSGGHAVYYPIEVRISEYHPHPWIAIPQVNKTGGDSRIVSNGHRPTREKESGYVGDQAVWPSRLSPNSSRSRRHTRFQDHESISPSSVCLAVQTRCVFSCILINSSQSRDGVPSVPSDQQRGIKLLCSNRPMGYDLTAEIIGVARRQTVSLGTRE
jgi:hypothetical protein